MKRNAINFVIDFMTLVAILGMVGTGLVVRYALPPGTGGRLTIWGMDRHDWGNVHFGIALGLGALLLVHLAMHWSWVCMFTLRWITPRPQSIPHVSHFRRNLGVVAVLALIVAAVWGFYGAATAGIQETRLNERGIGYNRQYRLESTPKTGSDDLDDPRPRRGRENGQGLGDRGGRQFRGGRGPASDGRKDRFS